MKNYLINELNISHEHITYANMFVNSNYIHFLEWVKKLNEEVIVIANKNGLNNLDKFSV